jgi:hypothetical protein
MFAQQIELMKEIRNWFSGEPKLLLELFLNFDTESGTQNVGGKELLPGIQWKISQQICASLCNISEKCGEFLAVQIRESQSTPVLTPSKAADIEVTQILDGVSGMTLARERAQLLRKGAFEPISQIVQCLAKAAASSRGHKFWNLVDSWSNPGRGRIVLILFVRKKPTVRGHVEIYHKTTHQMCL